MLDLSWNGLGEKGGVALADSLLVNTTIQQLDLSANRLNFNVATKFAKVISANESLTDLQVRYLLLVSRVHSVVEFFEIVREIFHTSISLSLLNEEKGTDLKTVYLYNLTHNICYMILYNIIYTILYNNITIYCISP